MNKKLFYNKFELQNFYNKLVNFVAFTCQCQQFKKKKKRKKKKEKGLIPNAMYSRMSILNFKLLQSFWFC